MNKLIEMALAKELIELSSRNTKNTDYVTRSLINGSIVEDEAFSGFSIIKEIVNSGVSLLTIVEYKDKIAPVIEHIAENAYDDKITKFIIEQLTTNDVKNLNLNMIETIYSATDYNSEILEKFFELGFNFKQGTFNEVEKSLNSNIGFFELCLRFKPDFKFNYKYDDLFLDEHLKEDIDYMKQNKSTYINSTALKNQESLFVFLVKIRETEYLKDDLIINLKNNYISKVNLTKI